MKSTYKNKIEDRFMLEQQIKNTLKEPLKKLADTYHDIVLMLMKRIIFKNVVGVVLRTQEEI